VPAAVLARVPSAGAGACVFALRDPTQLPSTIGRTSVIQRSKVSSS
jgi:hypothetical protein